MFENTWGLSSLEVLEIDAMSLFAEGILYGMHCILFTLAIFTMRNRGLWSLKFLLISTIAIFLLSTCHLIVAAIATSRYFSAGAEARYDSIAYRWGWAKIVSNVLTTTIADAVLIHRCYCIWNFRKRVIVFPILLVLAVTGLGLASSPQNFVRTPMLLVTNMLLTGLTVGRIWWIMRDARVLECKHATLPMQKHAQRYHTILNAILESAALYSICLAISMFFVFLYPLQIYLDLVIDAMVPITGICATLVAVLVGLGRDAYTHTQTLTKLSAFQGVPQESNESGRA